MIRSLGNMIYEENLEEMEYLVQTRRDLGGFDKSENN